MDKDWNMIHCMEMNDIIWKDSKFKESVWIRSSKLIKSNKQKRGKAKNEMSI